MVLLAFTETLAAGFYNVGLAVQEVNQGDRSRKQRRSKNDIVQAFTDQALAILCLSALGALNESLDDALRGGTKRWIDKLIKQSNELRGVTINIRNDEQYFTLVKDTRVYINDYKIVKDLIPEQEDRSYQFFTVCEGRQ